MNSTIKAGAERGERSETREAPPFDNIINTTMKTYTNSTMKAGAERGERREAREAPHP